MGGQGSDFCRLKIAFAVSTDFQAKVFPSRPKVNFFKIRYPVRVDSDGDGTADPANYGGGQRYLLQSSSSFAAGYFGWLRLLALIENDTSADYRRNGTSLEFPAFEWRVA